MATRHLLPVLAVVAFAVGCGGEEGDLEAKTGGLDTPPPPAPVAAPDVTAPTAATRPADSMGSPVAAITDSVAADSSASVNPLENADVREGREYFSYTGGSRDPFVSLLESSRVGPELPDLVLVAIYYDTRSPSNSVAVMREKVSSKRHNLRQGDRIGRIRVASVRPKDVTFSIDDFGTERQETLTLRKQEDTP